jgi:hypothetical protein
MGLPRSTFYAAPGRKATDAEIEAERQRGREAERQRGREALDAFQAWGDKVGFWKIHEYDKADLAGHLYQPASGRRDVDRGAPSGR